VTSSSDAEKALLEVAREKELHLTVRGRRSGQPRTVTIWFVVDGDAIAVGSLRDDRNWIRNARATSEVEVEIGGRRWTGRIRNAEPPEHARIRSAMARKYLPFRIASWLGMGQKFTFRIEALRPAGPA
jgi:deazaflavin-dependent oxidoreductase (nitroreductase family)